MKTINTLILAALVITLSSCGGSSSSGNAGAGGGVGNNQSIKDLQDFIINPFPADNPWNQDISNEPVDPKSDIYISSINSGSRKKMHPAFGTWWDGQPIGMPFVYVKGDQKKVPMSFLYDQSSEPGPYPIPLDAPIQDGPDSTGDRHVIVVDVDNGMLYELYNAFLDGKGGWKADSGAIFDLRSNKMRPKDWTSADAAGLPIYPALVKYDEVMVKKEITHALRFTAYKTRRAYVYPATHQASPHTDANLPPMGARLRLKASYDISKHSEAAQVILRGLKKYGMILADNGESWMISGTHDDRWDDQELGSIKSVPGTAFEVVKMGEIQYPNY